MAYRDESKYRHLAPQYDPGFLDGLDNRTRLHRELTTRIEVVISDLGGEDNLTYVKQALVRHFIFLDAMLDCMAVQIAKEGTAEHLGKYSVAFNTLIGVAKTLGLERQSKKVSLDDYSKQVSDDAS